MDYPPGLEGLVRQFRLIAAATDKHKLHLTLSVLLFSVMFHHYHSVCVCLCCMLYVCHSPPNFAAPALCTARRAPTRRGRAPGSAPARPPPFARAGRTDRATPLAPQCSPTPPLRRRAPPRISLNGSKENVMIRIVMHAQVIAASAGEREGEEEGGGALYSDPRVIINYAVAKPFSKRDGDEGDINPKASKATTTVRVYSGLIHIYFHHFY